MPSNRLLSLPTITVLNRVIGGYYDGTKSVGIRIDRHAYLHDFFGECSVDISDAPSIPKKVRATLDRLNETPAEHNHLKRLIEQVADPRYYSGEDHAVTLEYLNVALRGDVFELRLIGSKYRLYALGTNSIAASALSAQANKLDMRSVQEDFERAISEADRDPADAVTAACSTVESVCKSILDEMGKPYPAKQDIQGLNREVTNHLNLSPGRKDLPPGWEQDIRAILQALATCAQGIGALRTKAGDAHGRGKNAVPVDGRIARLAIHAASTLCLFYIETWQKAVSAQRGQ